MALFVILFCVAMLVSTLAYHFINHKFGYWPYVLLKTITSFVFVLSAYLAIKNPDICAQKNFELYKILILYGGIFGFAGDFILTMVEKFGDKMFIIGIFAFFFNHVMYIIALCVNTKLALIDIVLTVALMAVMIIFKYIFKLKIAKNLIVPCFFYLTIISFMLIKSFSFLYSGEVITQRNVVFLVGALLFILSDIVLALNKFSPKYRQWLDCVNTFTYFPGQLIISFTILL